MSDETKPAPTPPATPPTPAPAAAPAKPATAAPAPAKKDAPSPSAPRPTVVYAGIAALAVENLVAPYQHAVRAGETLESIAKDYYGDRKKAKVIREANQDVAGEGVVLVPGTKLKVPKG